jgi:hypothetical protein
MTGYESLAEVPACGDAVDRTALGDRLFDLHVNAEELPQLFERVAQGKVAPVKIFVRYNVTQKEGKICDASDQAICARSYLV